MPRINLTFFFKISLRYLVIRIQLW